MTLDYMSWEEQFDRELIPVDFLLELAGEKKSTDRGVDLAVAKFHLDLIKSFIRSTIADQRTQAAGEARQIEHCAEPNCPECNLAAYKKGKEDEHERILAAYEKAGIKIADLASRNGRLLASLESDAPLVVAFVNDTKFRSLLIPQV